MAEPFLLSVYAWKLTTGNKLTLALSSPWRKRFWVVEERVTKAGPEVFFSYYHGESKANNVKDAGDSVNVVEIISVGLLTMPRLAVYEGPGSTLPPESKQQLKLYRELICEIQTPSRVYFLRCEDRLELARLAGGLQRLSGLAAGEHAISWPVGFGPEPRAPACVLQARKLAGTLPPQVVQFNISAQNSAVAAAAARPPAAPTASQGVPHAAKPSAASKPSPASSIDSTESAVKQGSAAGSGGAAAPLSRSSSQHITRPGLPTTGASARLVGQASSTSLPSLGHASARARETVVIDAEEEERRYDQRLLASATGTSSATVPAGQGADGAAHSRGGSAGSRTALTALSSEVFASTPTSARSPAMSALPGAEGVVPASAAWKLGALEHAIQASFAASTQRPVLVSLSQVDAAAQASSGSSSAQHTPAHEQGKGGSAWAGAEGGQQQDRAAGSANQSSMPTPNKQRRPHVEGEGLPLRDAAVEHAGGGERGSSGRVAGTTSTAGAGTGGHSRVSSAGQERQAGPGANNVAGSRKSVLDDSSSDEEGGVDVRALARTHRGGGVGTQGGIRTGTPTQGVVNGGPSSWMTPPAQGAPTQASQAASTARQDSFSVAPTLGPRASGDVVPCGHVPPAGKQDWDDWDREGKEADSTVKHAAPVQQQPVRSLQSGTVSSERERKEGEGDSPVKVPQRAGPGVQADNDFATASWDE